MSVSAIKKIDLITQSKTTSEYFLVIVADEPWIDSDEFKYQLQEKVNNYSAYFLDGQMSEEYPDCKQQRMIIRLYSTTPIPKGILEFISKLSDAIKSHGIDLEIESI